MDSQKPNIVSISVESLLLKRVRFLSGTSSFEHVLDSLSFHLISQ